MKRANKKMPTESTTIVDHIAIRNFSPRSAGGSPGSGGTSYRRFFLRAAFSALRLSRAFWRSLGAYLADDALLPGGV